MSFSVAIIGAGMAGLSAASTLHAAGHRVQLFDKSRGSGGRLSSRRSEAGALDLGAQYFTAREPDFLRQVMHWHASGWVEAWSPALYRYRDGQLQASPDTETRWVGTPRMSALTRALLGQLPIHTSCRITQLMRRGKQWLLCDQHGNQQGPFSHLVLAIPAPQATALLSAVPDLARLTASIDMQPTWAVALGFETPLQTPVQGCFVEGNPLCWVARDSSKPGRDSTLDNWVLHASDAWSSRHLELSASSIIEQLKTAFTTIIGGPLPEPAFALAHRWLYARPSGKQPLGALCDGERGLYLCGDWCLSGRVEDAWHSGQLVAHKLLKQAASNDTRLSMETNLESHQSAKTAAVQMDGQDTP